MIIIAEFPEIQVEEAEVAEEITLTLRTTSPTAPCPSCGTQSSRIQSRYTRSLRDLPSAGRPIRLIMHVRRFFCKKSTCAQKIFTERLPDLCRPHAQRTKRLQEALCRLGLRAGGQAGADSAQEHGLSGSRDTILRLVRLFKQPAESSARIIGLDDWARKRRFRYGTLICDLESSQPIDLLPDRDVSTVSAWLQKHPSIDRVSRDGSSEYASAIKKGAPQARQVSDRWHLVKNLAEWVSVQLAENLAQLRREEQARVQSEKPEGEQASEERRPTQTRRQAQLARQSERKARYEHILELQKQGMNSAEIAEKLAVTQRTIQRWIATGDIPYSRPRKERARLIDPYKTYVLERLQQGCRNKAQLERELRAKGYKGSGRAMYRYLSTLEASGLSPRKRSSASAHRPTVVRQPNPLLSLSASQATWLFFRKEEDLTPEEQENLRQLRQASPHIEAAYQLVETFLHMVRERTGQPLDEWLRAVEVSHLQAFKPFVVGVQKDKDAVLAGLTLPWSNGPLEGNVNRLKLIKKSMYGRAEFDLLKVRVLYQSKKTLERKKKYQNRQAQPVDHLKKPRTVKNETNSQHTTIEISKVA
jgi:transposase